MMGCPNEYDRSRPGYVIRASGPDFAKEYGENDAPEQHRSIEREVGQVVSHGGPVERLAGANFGEPLI